MPSGILPGSSLTGWCPVRCLDLVLVYWLRFLIWVFFSACVPDVQSVFLPFSRLDVFCGLYDGCLLRLPFFFHVDLLTSKNKDFISVRWFVLASCFGFRIFFPFRSDRYSRTSLGFRVCTWSCTVGCYCKESEGFTARIQTDSSHASVDTVLNMCRNEI